MTSRTRVSFEEALEKSGFGSYNYQLIGAIGLQTVAYICVVFNSSLIIPVSACELGTTVAQRGILAAGPLVGLIVGSGLWGILADVYGRRRTLLISLVSGGIMNIVASFSVNWIMLLVLQFITAILCSGQYSQGIAMLSESVPLLKRNAIIMAVTSITLLSQGILAVFAMPIVPLSFSYYIPVLNIYWNSWRTLLAIYSVPGFLTALWVYTLEESPKFEFSRGREEESLKILRKIHKMNHRRSSASFEVEEIVKLTSLEPPKTVKEQMFSLMKFPLLKYTLIMILLFVFQQIPSMLVWLPTIADKFVKVYETGNNTGLTLCGIMNSTIDAPIDPEVPPCSLHIKSMVIVLLQGVATSILNLLLSLVVNKVGRRNLVMIITSVCGLCGVAVNLVPNIFGSGALFLVFLLGIMVHGLYMAIGVALFPTYVRVFALSIALVGGRIANFATIQIINYLLKTNCELGFYIFSTIFIASAFLAAFLSDDRKSISNHKRNNEDVDI